LERDVREVAGMFRDIATLVNQQQEGIDTVGKNIDSAKDHAEKGAEELREAERLQNAARKKQCCILFIVLAVLAVIIVPTVIATTKSS
jgi:t-SNARE complex subunit (syntaxin)